MSLQEKPERKSIYPLLGLRSGSIVIKDVQVLKWGSELVLDCVYRYPPKELNFKVRFTDVRSLEWHVVKANPLEPGEHASVMNHDMGEPKHQGTARFATTLIELILSYGAVSVEKHWTPGAEV